MSPTYLPHCFSTRLYYIAANFASDLGKDSTYWLPLPHRPLAALHVAHSASCLPVTCGLHKIRAARLISAFTSVIHHIGQAASSDRRGRAHQQVLSCFFFMDRCLVVIFSLPLVISDTDALGDGDV